MRLRARAGCALLLALLLTGCATLSDLVRAPAPALAATDPARFVGRWEGEVDLTFPDRTLLVRGGTLTLRFVTPLTALARGRHPPRGHLPGV